MKIEVEKADWDVLCRVVMQFESSGLAPPCRCDVRCYYTCEYCLALEVAEREIEEANREDRN